MIERNSISKKKQKNIDSSFLRVKRNKNADYDENNANTGHFCGHTLVLFYMNMHESLFLYFHMKIFICDNTLCLYT